MIREKMTREEAIEILQGAIKKPNTKDGYLGQAIDMAIKALSQEPICDRDCEHCTWTECPIEPCEDAISRNAILNKIKEVCFSEEWLQFRVNKGSNGQRDFIIDYIKQLPSVTPTCEEREKGECPWYAG